MILSLVSCRNVPRVQEIKARFTDYHLVGEGICKLYMYQCCRSRDRSQDRFFLVSVLVSVSIPCGLGLGLDLGPLWSRRFDWSLVETSLFNHFATHENNRLFVFVFYLVPLKCKTISHFVTKLAVNANLLSRPRLWTHAHAALLGFDKLGIELWVTCTTCSKERTLSTLYYHSHVVSCVCVCVPVLPAHTVVNFLRKVLK